VYVGGIPHDWDEGALRSLFEGFGAITTVRINRGCHGAVVTRCVRVGSAR